MKFHLIRKNRYYVKFPVSHLSQLMINIILTIYEKIESFGDILQTLRHLIAEFQKLLRTKNLNYFLSKIFTFRTTRKKNLKYSPIRKFKEEPYDNFLVRDRRKLSKLSI